MLLILLNFIIFLQFLPFVASIAAIQAKVILSTHRNAPTNYGRTNSANLPMEEYGQKLSQIGHKSSKISRSLSVSMANRNERHHRLIAKNFVDDKNSVFVRPPSADFVVDKGSGFVMRSPNFGEDEEESGGFVGQPDFWSKAEVEEQYQPAKHQAADDDNVAAKQKIEEGKKQLEVAAQLAQRVAGQPVVAFVDYWRCVQSKHNNEKGGRRLPARAIAQIVIELIDAFKNRASADEFDVIGSPIAFDGIVKPSQFLVHKMFIAGFSDAELEEGNVRIEFRPQASAAAALMPEQLLMEELFYKSPEQIMQNENGFSDERQIVWSLGVILYALITGRLGRTALGDGGGATLAPLTIRGMPTADETRKPISSSGHAPRIKHSGKQQLGSFAKLLVARGSLENGRTLLYSAEGMHQLVRECLDKDEELPIEWGDELLIGPDHQSIGRVAKLCLQIQPQNRIVVGEIRQLLEEISERKK